MVRRLPLFMLFFVPAILIGLQQPPPMARGVRIVDITAAVPEAGGFQPDSVTVYAGQRVQLRFRSADTTHGVAIGPGLGIDLGDLAPGEVKVVDVTFPEAGTYTFYCNKWCSPNHWRMRGVIAVEDPRGPAPSCRMILSSRVWRPKASTLTRTWRTALGRRIRAAHMAACRRPRRWLPRSSRQPRSTPRTVPPATARRGTARASMRPRRRSRRRLLPTPNVWRPGAATCCMPRSGGAGWGPGCRTSGRCLRPRRRGRWSTISGGWRMGGREHCARGAAHRVGGAAV